MDSELVTGIVALLTAALTVYQEWRHRKNKKAGVYDLSRAAKSGPFETRPVARPKVKK